MSRIALVALLLSACGTTNAPSVPAHDIFISGDAHAAGLGTPYLCANPTTGAFEQCPIGRPDPANLSCDAAGCHGGNDYAAQYTAAERDLSGSDGPSCDHCHGQRWSERVQ